MKTTTRQKWAARVREWRAGGQPATVFAAGKGFEAATLRWWASQLGREAPLRILPVVARVRSAAPEASLVVEVGAARVRVRPGFDGALLAQVVRALEGGR